MKRSTAIGHLVEMAEVATERLRLRELLDRRRQLPGSIAVMETYAEAATINGHPVRAREPHDEAVGLLGRRADARRSPFWTPGRQYP